MNAFDIQSGLAAIATLGMFLAQAWAFVDAATRRTDAFVAADKLTKPAWLIFLGLALVVHMIFWAPLSFLNLIGIVVAIVYLVDVRPAIRALSGR